MASRHIEQRVTRLETRLAEVEGCHGETIYELKRDSIENRIGMRMILQRLDLPPVTAEHIDEVLDEA